MRFRKAFFSLVKPIIFWIISLGIIAEFLLHIFIKDLPYKFINHTEGPIRRLAQYSKDSVIPEKHLAMIGDSNVYGFGPWLYDNSWSMSQPAFATHHLLYEQLGSDVIAYGYPGFGTFGYCLSAVSEHKLISNSWIWPDVDDPSRLLIVFYEGNDLVNNLHEFEQRGISLSSVEESEFDLIIKTTFEKEILKLDDSWSVKDHFAAWNLSSGLIANYFNRYFPKSDVVNKKNPPQKIAATNTASSEDKLNFAVIDKQEVNLGFCEGPALLLSQEETSFALKITKESVLYVAKSFPSTKIDIVYLPSALSVYNFGQCRLKSAPIKLLGECRDQTFSQGHVTFRNQYLRTEVAKIARDCSVGFIDATPLFKLKGRSIQMHGPRDPIHLNRAGYEAFAEILKHALSKS